MQLQSISGLFITTILTGSLVSCGSGSGGNSEPLEAAIVTHDPANGAGDSLNQSTTPSPVEECRVPGTFPAELLKSFLAWNPVLAGDVAFRSNGHGGILVRSYLSPSTAKHMLSSANPYPLPVGSLLAKAVVATSETPASAATRVYFMHKEAPGFDTQNGDWSYAVAKLTGSNLAFDPSVSPRDAQCVSCHTRFKVYDYVKTTDFFRRGVVN